MQTETDSQTEAQTELERENEQNIKIFTTRQTDRYLCM